MIFKPLLYLSISPAHLLSLSLLFHLSITILHYSISVFLSQSPFISITVSLFIFLCPITFTSLSISATLSVSVCLITFVFLNLCHSLCVRLSDSLHYTVHICQVSGQDIAGLMKVWTTRMGYPYLTVRTLIIRTYPTNGIFLYFFQLYISFQI